MLQSLMSPDRVNLVDEPSFAIGDMLVEPARLTIACGDARERLEPRVMAVLVVLAQAAGRVVSRDELVDRCWDGRIVGDNAIQRVISRLRRLSATLDGFEIQTVTKVGYLMRATRPEALSVIADVEVPPTRTPTPTQIPTLTPPAAVDRRFVIGTAAALAAGTAGALVWSRARASDSNAAAARRLVDKAREAELAGLRESNVQAIAYLKRATQIHPESPEAWGSLALAYRNQMEQSGDEALPQLAEWTRSAAGRALALDPGSTSARVALATVPPNFRRWAANERVLRALQQVHPPYSPLEFALGWLLCDTGRWQDAIASFRRSLALEPYHPVSQLMLSLALWGGGNLDEAEQLLAGAINLWPQNRSIWQARFDFLALTGRPQAAVAFVDNIDSRPVISPEQEPLPYAALRDFAMVLQTGSASDLARVALLLEEVRGAIGTGHVVTYLAALGRRDEAFEMLQKRFFGGGTMPPPGPLSRRKTSILFSARGATLRGDTRYPDMIRRVGLDSYWRETGTRPDAELVGAIRF